jgi:hypothetical protein
MVVVLPLYHLEFQFTVRWDKPNGETGPVFGSSRLLILNLAFITTDANIMGETIPMCEAEDYILEWFY